MFLILLSAILTVTCPLRTNVPAVELTWPAFASCRKPKRHQNVSIGKYTTFALGCPCIFFLRGKRADKTRWNILSDPNVRLLFFNMATGIVRWTYIQNCMTRDSSTAIIYFSQVYYLLKIWNSVYYFNTCSVFMRTGMCIEQNQLKNLIYLKKPFTFDPLQKFNRIISK